MATLVNNPTNAPPRPNAALPWTTEKHRQIIQMVRTEKKKIDTFNNGKDYEDEGAPPPLLLQTGLFGDQQPKPRPYAWSGGGIVETGAYLQSLKDFGNIDKTAQGTGISYLREAVVMDVDAKLIISTENQMRNGVFRECHYPTMHEYIKSDHYKRLREANVQVQQIIRKAEKTKFREAASKDTPIGIRFNPSLVTAVNARDKLLMKRFRESDVGSFSGSLAPDWDGGLSFEVGGRVPPFTPLIAGPYNKQLYYFDYLDMHSKAFEAWTHNPIAKRIVDVTKQFVLGKGVRLTVTKAELKTGNTQPHPQTGQQVPVYEDYTENCQAILDRHWMKNSLHIRSKQILQDLIIFGEQFIRYYEASWGLRIRSLDPSTIWEVITDPDDVENEFYIHQQYPTQYQWYVDLPVPTIKFIIRQVPALQYYHMKINATSTEKRGRSQLFTILGYLRRMKEYIDDRIVRNKMANLFVLDIAVEGDASAVQAVQQQFSTPPIPGSWFIHNKAAELNGVGVEVGASDTHMDGDLILQFISMGSGISMRYLGGSGGEGGKAGALVETEPDIKTFEDYQELMEQFFYQDGQRVFVRAAERKEIPGGLDIKIEATYPALAEENRSEKLKDLAFGESMSWWSHRRVASAAAKEMQFTSYDYDEEQAEIAQEDAQKEFLINTAYQQVTKGVDSAQQKAMGAGGTASGSSGKGASGMGFGRALASVRESREAPATAPGTSTYSGVSSYATPHNASVGGKKLPWQADPRDVADGIKREAANLRFDRHAIGRRADRIQSPDKVRDQKELLGKVKDARKSLRSGNFNHESEEGGPGSGPHKRQALELERLKLVNKAFRAISNSPRQLRIKKQIKDIEDRLKSLPQKESHVPIMRFPRLRKRESVFEPFKKQDGDRAQKPRVEHVEDHQGHARGSGKRMSPSGFGANKKERI